MTQWEQEQKIEKLNVMLIKHEKIACSYLYNDDDYQPGEDRVINSRGKIIEYVKKVIKEVQDDRTGS